MTAGVRIFRAHDVRENRQAADVARAAEFADRLALARQGDAAMKNLYAGIPDNLVEEQFEALLRAGPVRIERILSRGQTSPARGWYDQAEHEWVLVLEGRGIIGFADGREITLQKGDCLNIPAHVKHKVKWTDPDSTTIWLCVFYKG